jgi:hypothetical protein
MAANRECVGKLPVAGIVQKPFVWFGIIISWQPPYKQVCCCLRTLLLLPAVLLLLLLLLLRDMTHSLIQRIRHVGNWPLSTGGSSD